MVLRCRAGPPLEVACGVKLRGRRRAAVFRCTWAEVPVPRAVGSPTPLYMSRGAVCCGGLAVGGHPDFNVGNPVAGTMPAVGGEMWDGNEIGKYNFHIDTRVITASLSSTGLLNSQKTSIADSGLGWRSDLRLVRSVVDFTPVESRAAVRAYGWTISGRGS